MNEEITEYIIRELGRHRPENDIVRNVACCANVSWDEARRLVAEVKAKHRGRVVRRQSPVLLALGVATFIGGFFLSMGMVLATLGGAVVFFINVPVPYLGNMVYFVTGLGMMAGGAWGLGPVVLELLTARDQED
jgi:hypothetical protein